MKKLIFTILIATFGLIAKAQTCNVSLSIQQGQSSSSLQGAVHVNGSLGTPVGSSYYKFVLNLGNGIKDSSINRYGNGYFYYYTYSTPGTYIISIKMEVRDSANGNALICTSYNQDTLHIPVVASSSANFTHSQAGSGSLTMNFYDQSRGTSTRGFYSVYDWDFGDGSSGSTVKNPVHTYTNPGQYSVTLRHGIVDSLTNILLCTAQQTLSQINPGTRDTCVARFNEYHAPNSLTVSFSNSSIASSANTQGLDQLFSWDFGDGNSSSMDYPVHTYAQQGIYSVTLIMEVRDSLTQAFICADTVSKNINVKQVTSPTCKASYYVDTASSGGGNLIVYNNSTPALNNPNYAVSYGWNFGDGDSSSLPYPTHTYTNPGAYVVCLGISVTDTNNLTCWDYFCDTVGIDSLGNVIYKSASTGFTLNVLDPTVSNMEYHLAEVQLYPNPANDIIHIEGLEQASEWYLHNLTGARAAHGKLNDGENAIRLSGIPNGLYMLTLQSGEGIVNLKVQVER